MCILKTADSHRPVNEAIRYILNPLKCEGRGMSLLIGGTPNELAKQMENTYRLYGKIPKDNDRTFYHYKISFHPDDRVENGGILDEILALEFARDFVQREFLGHEAVFSVHAERARHIHIIINAISLETGYKLHMNNRQYAALKDRVQQMCVEYGLRSLDWRKLTDAKRKEESEPDNAVVETFAETSLRQRGITPWKQELREIIDEALLKCKNIDEFGAELSKNNVILTRLSDNIISYKYGDHKAVRGDTLGGDYTRKAISNTLAHNLKTADRIDNHNGNLMAMIASASKRSGKQMDENTRRQMREYGRQFGVKRADVDQLCDNACKLTYAEKKELWMHYREISTIFWINMQAERDRINHKISDEYERLRAISRWVNRLIYCSDDLFSCLFALIVVIAEFAAEHKIRNNIDKLIDERDSLKKLYEKHKVQKKYVRENIKTEDVENVLTALADLEKSVSEIYVSKEKQKYINR